MTRPALTQRSPLVRFACSRLLPLTRLIRKLTGGRFCYGEAVWVMRRHQTSMLQVADQYDHLAAEQRLRNQKPAV